MLFVLVFISMSDSRILVFLSSAFIARSFTDMQETGRATVTHICARGPVMFCASSYAHFWKHRRSICSDARPEQMILFY